MASATDKPRARRRGAMEERSMVMDRMMIRYGVLAQDKGAEYRVRWLNSNVVCECDTGGLRHTRYRMSFGGGNPRSAESFRKASHPVATTVSATSTTGDSRSGAMGSFTLPATVRYQTTV
jgi:hypothetical protein